MVGLDDSSFGSKPNDLIEVYARWNRFLHSQQFFTMHLNLQAQFWCPVMRGRRD
jgi:hypothetical protein